MSLCVTTSLCIGSYAQEQQSDSVAIQELDEVVVSDSRFKLKRENSGKTVIKISSEELKRNQGKSIPEIINTKSGFEIAGNRGRDGAILGVFARGGRGRQVLIIIDGVRVSDPSSFSSEYDMRLLSAANVESIEIIKGASSTLYGPNAATAVISITTKKSSDQKIALNVTSSAGTNQTAENQNYNLSRSSNSAVVSGTLDKFSYSIGGSNTYAEGLSALVTSGDEEDPFSKISVDAKLGYRFSDRFHLNLYANQTKVKNDFDESFGLSDAPYSFTAKQERIGIASVYDYNKGSFTINAAYSDYNSDSKSAFPSTFTARNLVVDAFNKYNFNDKFYTVIGLNYIDDKADLENDENFTIMDPYANVVYVSDFGLNLNAGARFNNHSEYGSNFVFNFNPSFVLKADEGYVKVFASYATAYITPNLTQLFGAFGANPDLEPEEDRTIEGGIEYYTSKKLRLSALYFNRKEENFITFDPVTFGSINAENTIDAQGVEVELGWNPLESLQFDFNYTFTERKGDNAIRIPKHKLNAMLGYQFSDRTNASLTYALTGQRFDSDFSTFPAMDIPLDAFSLIDIYFSHEVIPSKLRVFLNVNNLLNESFTEIIGFTARGRNIRVGFSLNL
ncbi:TonB-dependent receptor plug domain-containing protein [Maribacter sp. 2308TA10-17]|uniref:TonB-dependent receptor plug domain-containing protein n=1 Tax=Maribacter sp. 2308TA10-17 TaxID=3386276 RepID=UPI0039BC31B2